MDALNVQKCIAFAKDIVHLREDGVLVDKEEVLLAEEIVRLGDIPDYDLINTLYNQKKEFELGEELAVSLFPITAPLLFGGEKTS